MNSIDAIFCINLRRRVDRLSSFINTFPKQWITKLRIVGAVDGQFHDLSLVEKHKLRNADWNIEKKRGVWGCSLSHEMVFREIILKNYNRIVILEDDAVFSGSFDTFDKIVNQLISNEIGLCFLGPANHPENTILNHKFQVLLNMDNICSIDFNLGTMAYYITNKTANDLCNIIDTRGHYRAIDYLISDYMKQRLCSLPVFSIRENLGSDVS